MPLALLHYLNRIRKKVFLLNLIALFSFQLPKAQMPVSIITNKYCENLAKLNTGKSVFIFYDLFCPISLTYFRDLMALNNEYKDRYRFYWVFTPMTDLKTIRKDGRLSGDGVHIIFDKHLLLAEKFGISVLPAVVVCNENIAVKYSGLIDDRFEKIGVRRAMITRYYLKEALNAPTLLENTIPIGCIFK